MVKKRGLLIAIMIVLVLSGVNIFLFTNKGETSYASISGRYMEEYEELPMGLNLSIVAFVIQWIILLSILFFAYTKFIKQKEQEHVKLDYNLIKKKKTRAETDLDTLYKLLKNKKNLNVEAIGKAFNITKEKALEWAKILENHELVRIEYPAFSAPEVKINEKEGEKEKGKEKGPKKKEQKGKRPEEEKGKKKQAKDKKSEEKK